MKRVRLFVAIPVPPDLRRDLLRQISPMAGKEFRLTEEGNLHVTVHFIGEVDASGVPEIQQRLKEVASRHRPFTLQVQTVGPGPNRRRPRLLWAECGPPESFAQLARDVAAALAGFGNTEEVRHPRPHVTLARLRRGMEVPQAPVQLPYRSDGYIPVREIALWKSEMSPGGSLYTPLMIFPLS